MKNKLVDTFPISKKVELCLLIALSNEILKFINMVLNFWMSKMRSVLAWGKDYLGLAGRELWKGMTRTNLIWDGAY